ncbi:MAG: PQQ-like beta-propeller repeat protein [Gemmataceae bacterium]|nr:PQQ-like beta-propeller repeat protein [Gemmataceae bacterium]
MTQISVTSRWIVWRSSGMLLPLLILSGLSFGLLLPLQGADWPQFRGPNGSGVSTEAPLPVEWSRTHNIAWQASLPGRGVSSPIVVGDRVYLTASSGPRGDRLHLLAYDAHRGTLLWHRQLQATGPTHCHPKTCMAAHTPAADAQGVYALFASGDLLACNPDGSLRWYRSLASDYPTISNQVGMAASLILIEGKLIVPMDNVGESFLAALDIRDGRNLWKAERPREINWVTPVVRPHTEGAEILLAGPRGLYAYDVATGQVRWSFKEAAFTVPLPLLEDEAVYLPVQGVSKFSLGPDGIRGKPLWQNRSLQTGYSSPLLYRGRIYTASSTGFITAADATSGKELFRERVKGAFSASPVAGDGKVYCFNETGTCYVLDARTDTFELLATNSLEEETLATPAIAHQRLYVRTDKTLYAIGLK